MKRRDFFRTAGVGSAAMLSLPTLTGVLAEPARAGSKLDGPPADTFSVLLSGPYEPVAKCPDLDLTTVNVCDGSYSTTTIYPVSGLPVNGGKRANDPHRASPIGRFYVQLVGNNCAYELPGGTIAMVFTTNNLVPVPDGQGDTYLVGTIQLNITEATGAYKKFVGGHNNMVDILRNLADGSFVEDCFCNISVT
jgi:hypothetical protein